MMSAALYASMLVGCGDSGPPLGDVSGTVMIDNQPASGVNVNFQPVEGGRGSTAKTDENGHYVLVYSPSSMGALVGSHTVSISGSEPGIGISYDASGDRLVQSSSIPQKYLEMT